MSAGICIFCCSILLLAGVFVSVSADQKIITVRSGQDVTLPCQAPNNKDSIRVVRWTKPGLQDENVYLYRDGQFESEEQNQIFKDRVDLQDRQMKDGNVSLILKDVTADDSGAYHCLVLQLEATRSRSNQITTIELRVDPSGQSGGSVGLKVGLYVPVLLLVFILFFEVQNM